MNALRRLLKGFCRQWVSAIGFARAVFRWPKIFIEQLTQNVETYNIDQTFKNNVDALPKWVPLKVKIALRTVEIAWHLANLDFSQGLEGMYRYSIMNKVVNDLVSSMIHKEMLTEKIINDFISYEKSIKAGNLIGVGLVWDFYEAAYCGLIFDRPYESILEVLLKHTFITPGVYNEYLNEVMRLDRILRDHDAVMYSGSNSHSLLKGYSDEYFKARLFIDESISLSKLEGLIDVK